MCHCSCDRALIETAVIVLLLQNVLIQTPSVSHICGAAERKRKINCYFISVVLEITSVCFLENLPRFIAMKLITRCLEGSMFINLTWVITVVQLQG